jgi:acyl-coenzyme A thioesterase PaaI-like protein
VHAIALMNLGEVATGTAVLMGLKPGMRAIIVELRMEYLKKARGLITAEGTAPVPESTEAAELLASADLKNEAGEVVARAHARWKVGPDRSSPGVGADPLAHSGG